jgi:transposase
MAFFLKKTKNNKGTYLQIYDSFHDPESGQTRHRSYKAIGYVHELRERGLDDPIAFYKLEVKKLNQERNRKKQDGKTKMVSEESIERNLGYFLWKSINDGLGVQKYLSLLQRDYKIKFDLYEALASLIYARVVKPCSKRKTYWDVLPLLYESSDLSLEQIYNAVEILGNEYEKIIEIYNYQVNLFYPFDLQQTFFDCTNFYFEIDREDDLRRKGPSKENRYDPIVGMGLLLDAKQIPLGMHIYPGNQSEKPIQREVLKGLKERYEIKGRSIRIADKGLNCGQNIYQVLMDGDGYIFSKSVKGLPAVEKDWILLENDYREVYDKEGEVRLKVKSCVDTFPYTFTDEDGKEITELLYEKRLVIYNPKLAKKKREEILKEVEKIRNLTLSGAKRKEFGDRAKYVDFVSNGSKVCPQLKQEKIEEDLQLAGYNLLVTSELKMDDMAIYNAYHELWRIEEYFRILKSDLDARPVFLQKENSIKGHFLVCYLAVLILRLLQFKVFEHKFNSNEIIGFARNYRIVPASQYNYLNLSRKSEFASYLAKSTGLNIMDYRLSDRKINSMLKYRF